MKQTELITNTDDTIFHLRLKGEDIADKVIVVGDPGRVELVASLFDIIKIRKANREFHTISGVYKGKELTVISSGIGTDNIDILLNELNAAVNFNLKSKQPLSNRRVLTIVRMGTSGGLQKNLDPGTLLASSAAIGFDNVMNFYKGIEDISDNNFESALMAHLDWPERLSTPYIVEADNELLKRFTDKGIISGLTISAPGFYAPQGRTLEIEPFNTSINDLLETFIYADRKICNYEMESSAIYGLSTLMGHKALTICSIIGNRISGKFLNNYRKSIMDLAKIVVETI